ncbi:MAG: hypothetical protein H7287_14505 [Thermoleophilia bacterium]|nr:hypothetical protein [Thermoleophilia bacterium]
MSERPYPAEIHIVAAPTEAFLLRVQLLAASIRRTAGAFATSRIVVTLSRDCVPFDVDAAYPWSQSLGIEWRWVPEAMWEQHGIYGSALARFGWEVEAPYVIHLDADTIVTGQLDDLPARTASSFGGVIAHVAPSAFGIPFTDGVVHHGAAFWAQLHAGAGLGAPQLTSEHTGWGFMDVEPARRWCPPYYNLGLLAGTREVMARVATAIEYQLATVEEQVATHFRCQLAVMLALAATQTPSVDLAMQWNFPNDDAFCDAHPQAARDVRVLHYLRGGEFERERDTASLAALDAFLARPCTSLINERLRRHLAELRPGLGSTELPASAAHDATTHRLEQRVG